jgi:hypothetical protein
MKLPFSKRWLIFLGAAVAVVAIAWAGFYLYSLNQPIPQKTLKEAGYGIWYPTSKGLNLKVDRGTIKYTHTGPDKLVSFIARSETQNLTFTEQPQPESFNDVPQLYEKLIEKLRGYSNFDSVNGTVSLTRPEELKGGQTAVMKSKGTLVFIKPETDLSADDWRKIMNNLSFVH